MLTWFISDTHGQHNDVVVPTCAVDTVIFCGDEANHYDPAQNWHESMQFFHWFAALPIENKVFVPGNHSTAVEAGLVEPERWPEINFLIHDSITINGYKIFGSPYTPAYGRSWAYMHTRNRLQYVWSSVPECDILITHGPPKGILDLTHDRETGELTQAGCEYLWYRTNQIKPLVHAFGHIHQEAGCNNVGIFEKNGIEFVNCACYNHRDKELYHGHVIDLDSLGE